MHKSISSWWMGLVLTSGILAAVPAFAVIGGVRSPAGDMPEVVKLQSGKKVCTGTIIGPRAVVSAAHCATSESPFFNYRGHLYKVKYVSSRMAKAGHDLAVAITEKVIAGARMARIGGGVKHGSKMLIAGYGCTRKGGRPGGLHQGETQVIGMDGEHLLSGERRGSVLCEGDSGGPAFVRRAAGGLDFVAVNSLSDIKSININVRMDSPQTREFLTGVARVEGVDICGVNKNCP